ncbi:Minichromosome maintenance protein MCM [uncultured archaeon]|nr:Minichromosome maintenance protein MCM [uncultured archaeon]
MNYVMQKVMTDKETGLIDVSIMETGKTKSQIERNEVVYEIVKEMCKKFDVAEEDQIIVEAKNYNLDEHQVRKILEELVRSGQIYKPAHGKYHPA